MSSSRRLGPASAVSIPWRSSSLFLFGWGLGRPTGALDTQLLCVLGGQSLPAAELHGITAGDASDRLTREQPIQHIEADVPARGAPRDETAIDVVPEGEARAVAERLELPAEV